MRSVQQLRGKDVRPLAELAAPMCDSAACAPPPPPRFSVIGRKCRFSPEYLSLPVCSIFLRILRGTWINPTVAGNAILHARKRRYKSCLIIREHGALEIAVSLRRSHFSSQRPTHRSNRSEALTNHVLTVEQFFPLLPNPSL